MNGFRRGFTLIDPESLSRRSELRLTVRDHLRGDKNVERSAGKSGFTLIELLVVIAIVAVLAVVVVLVLNPASLLQQSRDSNRLSDISSLQSAINLYLADAALSGTVSVGSSSVVYVSIPDGTATSSAGDQCQGLALPLLPAAYSYHCAASSTVRLIGGTGWLPINFSSMSNGAPLSQLPQDPMNASSSRLYYTYATNGSQYEVTAAMESAKYKLGGSGDVITGDGGTLSTVFEKGSKLGLEPLDYGDKNLIGYWTLDEGTGTVAYDYAGTNATSSWNGTATGTSGYYSAGYVGPWGGTFDAATTYMANTGATTTFNLTNGITMIAWVKTTVASGTDQKIISKRPSYVLTVFTNNVPETEVFMASTSYDTRSAPSGTALAVGKWYQVAGTYDGATLKTYVNGALDRQISVTGNVDNVSYPVNLGKTADGVANYWGGQIDDARVYSRALTPAEISAMYIGGK